MNRPPPDDQTIYNFLLGNLDSREEFATRLADDPEFFELVEATEEDLILRYLRGELDRETAGAFETAYLPGRSPQVEAARVLMEATTAASARRAVRSPDEGRDHNGWWRWMFGRRLILAGGLALAAAALIAVLRSPTSPAPEPTFAAVVRLQPGMLRAGGEQGGYLRLGNNPRGAVRFELQVPPTSEEATKAVLRTPESRILWAGAPTGAARAAGMVTVEIPADRVVPGDLVLELSGAAGQLASYGFRVE